MNSLSRYENSQSPFVPLGLQLRGLGNAQQTAQIESIAGAGASASIATLVAMGTIAGPVGAAIGAGIGVILAIASTFKGCGETCIAATHIVDSVGPQLTQMFNAYMDSPVHYQSMQTAYLQAWDGFWNAVVQACSDPNLGDAGKRCISDRQSGACHYETPAGAWVQDTNGKWKFDGSAGPNCWNWFTGTRDPIANDPTVVPDPTPISASAGVVSAASNILANVTGGVRGGMSPMLLIGLLALGGFVFMSMDERH